MTKLSETQRVILSAAAQHKMGLARAPKTLPAAARNAVFRSLIKNNLLTEINAPRDYAGLGWRQNDDGAWIVARVTDEGMRAIGIDPNEGDVVADTAPTVAPDDASGESPAVTNEAAQAAPLTEEIALLDQLLAAPAATPRANLRDAATAVLEAWDDQAGRFGTHEGDMIGALDAPITALRTLLAGKPACVAREPGAPRKPREGKKQEQVLAMLCRPDGATVAQIAEATDWAQNTVRGFFAGLKKKGHAVEVRERIRQVRPNKTGAKGSYTVYALAG